MITEQKIKIYRKYQGDIDGIARGGRKSEKDLFEEDDWYLIDNVLQDIEMINKGLCSADYKKKKIENTVQKNFDNKAIDLLKKMINNSEQYKNIVK